MTRRTPENKKNYWPEKVFSRESSSVTAIANFCVISKLYLFHAFITKFLAGTLTMVCGTLDEKQLIRH
jgi:hypothetical protein